MPSPTKLVVRNLDTGDAAWAVEALVAEWGSVMVARRGQLVDASAYPGFVALLDDQLVGLAVVMIAARDYEVLSLSSQVRHRGVGRALMEHCFAHAGSLGCDRVWLTTTNDNVAAIAFYQRVGMDLCALHHGAVDVARQLKPAISRHDEHGVAIAHELEFELRLTS